MEGNGTGMSQDPRVFTTALDILKLLEVSLPPSPDGKHGKAGTALLAAMMALFVEDFGNHQEDWITMLAIMATRKPLSREEIAELAKGANDHVKFQ